MASPVGVDLDVCGLGLVKMVLFTHHWPVHAPHSEHVELTL